MCHTLSQGMEGRWLELVGLFVAQGLNHSYDPLLCPLALVPGCCPQTPQVGWMVLVVGWDPSHRLGCHPLVLGPQSRLPLQCLVSPPPAQCFLFELPHPFRGRTRRRLMRLLALSNVSLCSQGRPNSPKDFAVQDKIPVQRDQRIQHATKAHRCHS